eukprot:GFKZ01003293.1.p1 GENE.GFKZ01003293.1~~GFKZ01003293.1.p1  ORF type:complete len:361 (+),score=31.70 GFKZ01003293.1:84-1166(+)
MLEWNAFIKPLVYTIEIIFGVVVTAGTADKLLFHDPEQQATRCVLSDNIPVCASVISLGSICTLGGIYVLWKRLSSAFLSDMKYRHDTESIMCFFLSIGWLSVSSVLTAFRAPPADIQPDVLRAERTVTITFAWLLWVFHIGSIAIAWFAPDEDNLEPQSTTAFPSHQTFSYHFSNPSQPQPYPLPNPVPGLHSDGNSDHSDTEDNMLPVIDTSQESVPFHFDYDYGDLNSFLDQHDGLVDALPVTSQQGDNVPSINLPTSASFEQIRDLRPKETIQDLASAWNNIVTADIESERPEVDITTNMPQPSPREAVDSARTSATVSDSHQGGAQQRPFLRRRTVRFQGDETERGRPSTGGSSR